MHMRRHNPEKLFKCNQCNYEGNQRVILDSHVRSIHNNLWYHCEFCEHKTSQKSNLNRHVQIKHEGLVFGCDNCEYNAASNFSLIAHKELQHEGIRYQCDQCEYKSTSKHRPQRLLKRRALPQLLRSGHEEPDSQFSLPFSTRELRHASNLLVRQSAALQAWLRRSVGYQRFQPNVLRRGRERDS